MPITQINNLMQGAKLDNLIGETKPLTLNKEEKKNFEDVIIDTIDKVNFQQVTADDMKEKFIKGEDVSMHEVMLIGQEAQLSMQYLIEVRIRFMMHIKK
ncbi:flagellar hook-basal body complex protein FliE [Clostridioides difficile]|uniref:flagellar hook-basal body complex protein FliE n=1 Tax=Clostridioides difficile TaxID=1496 RepID=UPI00038C6D71|nr:flagellar hook-basal body complex protein FliE [Clostridioides difficile]EQE74353.1 flagellar hook-basal body complex FliE family protein [Clostridioides difficile CD47]